MGRGTFLYNYGELAAAIYRGGEARFYIIMVNWQQPYTVGARHVYIIMVNWQQPYTMGREKTRW